MKPTIYLIISTFLLLLTSCEVEVPDTDVTHPKFSFKIKSDGFDLTFTQDDNFDSFQLNVREGVDYEFILSRSNENGLGALAWAWNTESISYGLELGNLARFPNVSDRWSELLRTIYYAVDFDTDPSEVTTTAILTGSVTFSNITDEPRQINLDFSANEFTGSHESGSSVAKQLVPFIGDHPTELVLVD